MCLSVEQVTQNYESESEILEARLLNVKETSENDGCGKVEVPDLLAQSTQYTRQSFKIMLEATNKLKSSVYYKVLTRTTQPGHVASIILVLIISLSLWPEYQGDSQGRLEHKRSSFMVFVYLASFAAHFGAQIWMTFVSGLALYFSLPRHTFGMCQEILFPKYFLLNTALSSMTLITFAKSDANFHDQQWVAQLLILSLCVIIEASIYFYLTPTLLKLMRAKYQFEEKLGNGQEVGYQRTFQGFKCPRYQQIHKNFRKVHVKVAIGNIIAMCCTFQHLYYLALKIAAHSQ